MKKIIFIYNFICCIFISCSESIQGDISIAYIDENPIFLSQIDKLHEKELYNFSALVYDMRKEALNNYLDYLILLEEANNQNTTWKDIISQYNIVHGLQEENENNGTPRIPRSLIDSLRRKHSINILLPEPVAPELRLDSCIVIPIQDNNAKVTLTLIADVSCPSCKQLYPFIKRIVSKYGNRVNYNYINYGEDVSVYSKALIANCKNSYLLLDSLMSNAILPDSMQLVALMLSLGSTKEDCTNYLQCQYYSDRLNAHNTYIYEKGIYATPTVLINNRPIRDAHDTVAIESMLNRVIDKFYK